MLGKVRDSALVVIGAFIIGIGFNLFLIPHQLLSGGLSGLSMIIGYFTPLKISFMYIVLNLPLLIAGWFMVGRKFILLSLLSVVSTTVLLEVIPVKTVATDPLLSCVVGGALVGLGGGISFRAGGSSGGFDVLGAIISRRKDMSVGNIVILLNGIVILAIGYLSSDWNIALDSALSIYLTGKVMDLVFTSHSKVTLHIITDKSEELVQALLKLPPRGVTKIPSFGAFSGEQKNLLMTVTTRYELPRVKEVIRSVDANAFVNITNTVEVLGYFRKEVR